MKKLITTMGVFGAALLPYVVSAQSSAVQAVTRQATSFPQTQMTLSGVVLVFYKYVNTITPTLATLAVAFFFYGLIRYIYDAGNSKGHERGRQSMIWGLVAMFVIFSLWGIIQFLTLALFS